MQQVGLSKALGKLIQSLQEFTNAVCITLPMAYATMDRMVAAITSQIWYIQCLLEMCIDLYNIIPATGAQEDKKPHTGLPETSTQDVPKVAKPSASTLLAIPNPVEFSMSGPYKQ
eukprot:g44487.t1